MQNNPHNPTTQIYLIRHGDVDNPQKLIYGSTVPVSLSREGFQQLQKLGEGFKNQQVEPNAIYSSPLARCIDSSRALAGSFPGVPIKVLQELRDTDEPDLANKTIDWLESIGGNEYDETIPELKGLRIERPKHIIERMKRSLQRIRSENEGKAVFVVSHGDPLAFSMWRLQHPDEKVVPPVTTLVRPKRVTAWKIELNHEGKLEDIRLFDPSIHSTHGERAY
jgi:broad specificity phosphatase PhoE